MGCIGRYSFHKKSRPADNTSREGGLRSLYIDIPCLPSVLSYFWSEFRVSTRESKATSFSVMLVRKEERISTTRLPEVAFETMKLRSRFYYRSFDTVLPFARTTAAETLQTIFHSRHTSKHAIASAKATTKSMLDDHPLSL